MSTFSFVLNSLQAVLNWFKLIYPTNNNCSIYTLTQLKGTIDRYSSKIRLSFENRTIEKDDLAIDRIQSIVPNLLSVEQKQSSHILPESRAFKNLSPPHFPHDKGRNLLQSPHKVPIFPHISPGPPPHLGEADDKCIKCLWLKWKIICAYLKALAKYRRMVFFFLKYLFSF